MSKHIKYSFSNFYKINILESYINVDYLDTISFFSPCRSSDEVITFYTTKVKK